MGSGSLSNLTAQIPARGNTGISKKDNELAVRAVDRYAKTIDNPGEVATELMEELNLTPIERREE